MNHTIEFTKEQKLRAESTGHRAALIAEGIYSIPQHKVHKNKKKYERKQFNKNWD